MQRLGSVLHISPSQNIILRVEDVPKIGETVVDENLKSVGRVFDIFGPVSSPYAAIRPATPEPARFVNKKLYVIPSRRRKEKVRNE